MFLFRNGKPPPGRLVGVLRLPLWTLRHWHRCRFRQSNRICTALANII
jgi:hypothetical protein